MYYDHAGASAYDHHIVAWAIYMLEQKGILVPMSILISHAGY